jgi:hypothetical protein
MCHVWRLKKLQLYCRSKPYSKPPNPFRWKYAVLHFRPFTPCLRYLNPSKPGSILIAILAVGVLTFLSIVGFSISNLRLTQAQQVKGENVMLQLKMVAESGVNEAISTRMFPSSNRLSWGFNTSNEARNSTTPSTRPKPFFFDSSYVYQSTTGTNQILGRYQYVVLGTNPFMRQQANGTFVLDTTLIQRGAYLFNIKYPVYVVSRGIVCQDVKTGNIVTNTLNTDGNYGFRCSQNTRPRTHTIMAKLQPNPDATSPMVPAFQVASNREITTPEASIPLETPILNRNGLATQTFNFQQWWENTNQHSSPLGVAVPVALSVRSGVNESVIPWPNGVTTLQIPPGTNLDYVTAIFRGSVDERSLYVANNRFSPKDTVTMLAQDPLFPPANQATYSGVILRLNASLADGGVRTEALYPGAAALRFSIQTACQRSNNLVLNDKLALRDADGFLNTTRYTLNFADSCPPPPPGL